MSQRRIGADPEPAGGPTTCLQQGPLRVKRIRKSQHDRFLRRGLQAWQGKLLRPKAEVAPDIWDRRGDLGLLAQPAQWPESDTSHKHPQATRLPPDCEYLGGSTGQMPTSTSCRWPLFRCLYLQSWGKLGCLEEWRITTVTILFTRIISTPRECLAMITWGERTDLP